MSIWHIIPDLKVLNSGMKNTLGESLGMQITEIGDNYLCGTMPVDQRTKQPFGRLHGGAAVSLVETLGSVASQLVVDSSKYYAVGLEINANHVGGAFSGLVTGKAEALHIGRSTHLWDIKIHNNQQKLISVVRLTTIILDRS